MLWSADRKHVTGVANLLAYGVLADPLELYNRNRVTHVN
jgi:hypothetical protein